MNTPESNPARALAARLIVGIIGGVLVYIALPASSEYAGWWEASSHVPLILGTL